MFHVYAWRVDMCEVASPLLVVKTWSRLPLLRKPPRSAKGFPQIPLGSLKQSLYCGQSVDDLLRRINECVGVCYRDLNAALRRDMIDKGLQ